MPSFYDQNIDTEQKNILYYVKYNSFKLAQKTIALIDPLGSHLEAKKKRTWELEPTLSKGYKELHFRYVGGKLPLLKNYRAILQLVILSTFHDYPHFFSITDTTTSLIIFSYYIWIICIM